MPYLNEHGELIDEQLIEVANPINAFANAPAFDEVWGNDEHKYAQLLEVGQQAKKRKKKVGKMPSYKSPRPKFQYEPLNNGDEILSKDKDELYAGVEFSVISCPLVVWVVVLSNSREPRKLVEIPCEDLKPIGSSSYSVQKDAIMIDCVRSHRLGEMNFCYKLAVPHAFYEKIIPMPESLIRKHLTTGGFLDTLAKEFPESKGYQIKFVQFAGA